MEEKLFKDLMKVTKGEQHINKVIPKYCTASQKKRWSTWIDTTIGYMPPPPKTKRTNKSADTFVMERTIIMGGYGYRAAAEAACSDFERPTVFDYQTAIFPKPKFYEVEVKIKATPKELSKPGSELYPWAVVMKIGIKGDAMKAERWFKAFQDRTRGIRL